MAGVNSSLNKALESFLSEWKAHNSASLTLKSVKGELLVTLKMKLGRYGKKPDAGKGYQSLQRTQACPSQLRRREQRAADPVVQLKAAEHAASAAAAPSSAAPAGQAVAFAAGQAEAEEASQSTAEEAAPTAEQSAAGQAAADISPPVSSPPLTSPPSTSNSTFSPHGHGQSPIIQPSLPLPVTAPLPPSVTAPLPPPVWITSCPPPPSGTPVRAKKAKKARPQAAPSLDQDSHSQLECPVCDKLIQPRLMANHAKYFHVNTELGIECPKCDSEFTATSIFNHLLASHIV